MQLKGHMTLLASMHNNNAFHNFEHTSHVSKSAGKLLSRIVAPTGENEQTNKKHLHDHTYGTMSDPLTPVSYTHLTLPTNREV